MPPDPIKLGSGGSGGQLNSTDYNIFFGAYAFGLAGFHCHKMNMSVVLMLIGCNATLRAVGM